MPYHYNDNLTEIFAENRIVFIEKQLLALIKNQDFQNLKVLQKPSVSKIYKLRNIADKIKDSFNTLIIVGMGGSVLNPKTIIKFVETENKNKDNVVFKFLDTLDPVAINFILSKVDIKKTAFLIISKSGNTIETNCIASVLINICKKHGISSISKNFFFILSDNYSKLRTIAQDWNATIIKHPDISGRYSFFTEVALFPALINNVDIKQLCFGANKVIEEMYSLQANSAVVKGATFIALMHEVGKKLIVNLCYTNKLQAFMEWQEQLISESLGKNGKGITPQSKIGPSFQHSLLQLYLNGPKDKCFTLISVDELSDNFKSEYIDKQDFNYLNKILKVERECVYKTLKDATFPFREFIIKELSLSSLGALIAHNIIETVLVGYLLRLNPFDQPAVEYVKKEIEKYIF